MLFCFGLKQYIRRRRGAIKKSITGGGGGGRAGGGGGRAGGVVTTIGVSGIPSFRYQKKQNVKIRYAKLKLDCAGTKWIYLFSSPNTSNVASPAGSTTDPSPPSHAVDDTASYYASHQTGYDPYRLKKCCNETSGEMYAWHFVLLSLERVRERERIPFFASVCISMSSYSSRGGKPSSMGGGVLESTSSL